MNRTNIDNFCEYNCFFLTAKLLVILILRWFFSETSHFIWYWHLMGLEIFAFHKEKWLAFFLAPFFMTQHNLANFKKVVPPGSSQFFCYFLYLPKVVQFRKVGKEYIQVWRMWTWPKGGNFHLLLFLPPSSSLKVFLGKFWGQAGIRLTIGSFFTPIKSNILCWAHNFHQNLL